MENSPKKLIPGVLSEVTDYLPENSALLTLQTKLSEHVGKGPDELDLHDATTVMSQWLEIPDGIAELTPLHVIEGKADEKETSKPTLDCTLRFMEGAGAFLPALPGQEKPFPLIYNDLVSLSFMQMFCTAPEKLKSNAPMEIFREQMEQLKTTPYSFRVAEFLEKIGDGRAILVSAGYTVEYSQLTQRKELVYKATVEINGILHLVKFIPNTAERVSRRKQLTHNDGAPGILGIGNSHSPKYHSVDYARTHPTKFVIDCLYEAKARPSPAYVGKLGKVRTERPSLGRGRRRAAL